MRIFILITSILPVILSADDFTFPKEEERKCKGKCVRALECEIALNTNKVKGFRPEICFFYLQDPYVCCPIKGLNGTITGTFLGQTLSDKKCDEYYPYQKYEIHPIVGGQTAIPYDFEFMSAIGWSNGVGSSRFKCGGSLITPKHILTAAHCTFLDGQPPDFIRLRATNLSQTEGYDVPIKSIKTHPDYDPNVVYHDLAILELNEDVKILPACLWQTSNPPFKQTTALGYGHKEFAGVISNTLQRVELDLYQNNHCTKYYKRAESLPQGLTKQQICAGDILGKRDTCQGDSGGPLLVKLQREQSRVPHLIALTSFGGDCAGGVPGVYIRISQYLKWIESVVWKT